MFDPSTFMNQSMDKPLDTVVQQVPEGEYRAMIDDFDENVFDSFEGTKAKTQGRTFVTFKPGFVIQDDSVAAELGREKVVVYHQGIFLDFAPDGSLDTGKGKNVDLGRLREATNQNGAGPWTFNNLKGAGPVMVKVVQQASKDDPEKKYARVVKVTKIG